MLNSMARSTIIGAVLLSVMFVTPVALAQSPTVRPRVENRCARVVTRIDNTIARVEEKEVKVKEVFQKAADRLKEQGEKLQVKDPTAYETLSGYYNTLVNTYIGKISESFAVYKGSLESAQSMAQSGQCGSSDGAFKQAITDAKASHQQVKADVASAKNYYLEVIKPYRIDLRNQNRSDTGE